MTPGLGTLDFSFQPHQDGCNPINAKITEAKSILSRGQNKRQVIKKEICGFKWVSKGSPSLSQHNYVDAFLGILPGRIPILWIGLSKNELEKSHLRIPPNWYACES